MPKTEAIIEFYRVIQTYRAIRTIAKVLDKHDVTDCILFIRTPHNTFLEGLQAYSDMRTQLAEMITAAANTLNTTPHELLKELEIRILNKENIKIELESLLERKDSLSPEEFKDELEEIYNKHDISHDLSINELISKFL